MISQKCAYISNRFVWLTENVKTLLLTRCCGLFIYIYYYINCVNLNTVIFTVHDFFMECDSNEIGLLQEVAVTSRGSGLM